MSIWVTPISLEAIEDRSHKTLAEHLGITFTEIGDDFLVATMPVDHRVKQPIGIMHGGASCALAETVGSVAGNFCVDIREQYCVGLDINTNHIRAVRDGHVSAKATPFHLGRSTQVWSINITNQENQLISVNRLTLSVLTRK